MDTTQSNPTQSPVSNAAAAHTHLEASERHYTNTLRLEQPLVWWGTLLGPFAISIVMLLAAWAVKGWEYMINLVAASGAIFFGLGRAVLLIGTDHKVLSGWHKFVMGMSIHELAILVVWLDVLVAFIMVFHASYLYRIPKIGPAMLALQEDGEFILSQHPWFRRFAWLGLVAFVLIPFAATGSVGGSIVGRMLGLSRWATLSGVVAGSVASTAIVYFFTAQLKKSSWLSGENPWALAASIAFVLLLAALVNWRYRKVKARWAAKANAAHSGK